MKKIKRITASILAVSMTFIMSVSCSKTLPASSSISEVVSSSQSETTTPTKPLIIKDTAGRDVEIPEEIDSIIALNSNCYTMIKALGAEDLIIGVGDAVAAAVPSAGARNLPAYGSASKPNVEELVAADADLIITYAYIDKEILAKLETAGARVLLLELYIPSTVVEETLKLGEALNLNERALEVTTYISDCEKTISERLADLKPEEHVTVYWEGYSDYSSVGKGSGGDEIVTIAHGNNIAANEDAKYPKVNDEWVLEKNPDIIVKMVSSKNALMGEGFTDTTAIDKFYDTIVSRPGWNELTAVKNKKVLLLSQNIGTTPEGYFIGALYMAKMMYPEKLSDIEPYEMYQSFQKKFLNTDTNGIIAYSK